jgi:hypothetical protein
MMGIDEVSQLKCQPTTVWGAAVVHRQWTIGLLSSPWEQVAAAMDGLKHKTLVLTPFFWVSKNGI